MKCKENEKIAPKLIAIVNGLIQGSMNYLEINKGLFLDSHLIHDPQCSDDDHREDAPLFTCDDK